MARLITIKPASAFICLAFGMALPTAARADAPLDDQFHLKTSGAVWLMAMNGTTGLRNLESDVDADIGDVLDKANFAFNPGLELTKGNWVFQVCALIAQLEDSRTFRNGRGGDITATQAVVDLALGYTLVRTELGNGMPLTITPLVGGQITYMELELDPNNFPSESRDRTWFDPFIAGRATLGLTRDLDWRTEAMIGGFGASSDLIWSAGTFLDWHFHKRWSLNVGYRALAWDYDHDNLMWDMTLHGPWIGITTEWF